MNELEIKLMSSNLINDEFNLNKIIYDLDLEIERNSFNPDTLDYFVSIASGVLCALLDILWVGDFDLEKCHSRMSSLSPVCFANLTPKPKRSAWRPQRGRISRESLFRI